jgi:hypothetical protein
MENEFLTFESTDVELIGDVIEFDEEVQRGEKVRFYTLNEQVTDAFEHMVPKGRTTKAQIEKIGKEVDRVRDLYETYVGQAPEGYEVTVPKSLRSFPWVQPVVMRDEDTPILNGATFNFETEWTPLFGDQAYRQPNGYVRMLTALPSPFIPTEGTPYPIDVPTTFTSEDGKLAWRVLPAFTMNKTRRHEDGRIDIIPTPVAGTEDSVSFKGYWLKKRSLPIPDPLPDHPFLESNDERFIPTTEPLSNVVPELDAVMMHGVPVTQDPYGEGRKFLKVYDVSLDVIPWDLWKRRFPQKELVDVMPPPVELPFKEGENPPPSSNVVEEYGELYFPGLAARRWLMNQEDGGQLVVRMIQSLVGNAGTVEMLPVSDLGELRFPDVDENQCTLVGASFQDFVTRGVIRQLGKERKCLPLDIVKQERHQVGYRDRTQWKESTSNDMLIEYRKTLAQFKKRKPSTPKGVYEKYASRAVSRLREQVVAVLKDDERFPEDKLKAIELLTRDMPHTKQVAVDTEGSFVVCDHTLAILGGELAADRLGFYDTWTVRVEGSRVCKVCGEEINKDVLVNQEDFSEEGRVLKHADALDEKVFHGESTMTFTTKLRSLQEFFNASDSMDSTVFLLISLLQLIPAREQLIPVLQEGRAMAATIKSRDRDGKAQGMIGLAVTAFLLQTHLPQLVPRRSFGSVALKLDGFPRDTDVDKAPTVIDGLMMVLRKTFEAYPTSFKGPSVAVMRGVLSEPAVIRKGVIAIMKKLMPAFASPLARARAEFAVHPPAPPPVGLIPVRLPPEKLGVVTTFPPCGNPRSVWASDVPPVIRQPSVPLDRIRLLPATPPLPRTNVAPRPLMIPEVKDIQRRLRLPAVARTEGDSWRTNLMIVQRLKDAFQLELDISSIDVAQKPSLLRDISEGLLKEIMSGIVKDPIKKKAYEELREKDLALFALMYPLRDAKTETNTLRAKERHLFTDRLREMTDSQRQITKDLLDRGMAPFIITNADRDVFTAQIERELEPLQEPEPDMEVGVGAPRDAPDDDDRNADEGDYGDHNAQGNRDRDRDMPELDREGPI